MPCLYTKQFLLLAISQCVYACSLPQMTAKPDEAVAVASVPQHYDAAIDAIKSGKLAVAEKLFADMIVAQPDFANAYTNLGLIRLNKKQHDKAEDAFRRAIALNPGDAVAYNHLGVILREKGEFKESETMYLNAIKHNSDYATAHLNLGILYDLYLHDYPKALTRYQSHQQLTGGDDKLVDKWIMELEQRIKLENRS